MPLHSKRIKLCGITTIDAVEALNVHKVGFAGFIIASSSPRFVTPDSYQQLARAIDPSIHTVLVAVNPSNDELNSYIHAYRPHFLQLHGEESAVRCREVKAHYGIPIIKAIGIATHQDVVHATTFHDAVDMLLFDTRTADGSTGGTGKRFDWTLLKDNLPLLPWFLSGGIDNSNITEALAMPANYIDISSGVESQKGVKDIAKIAELMDSVRQFQQEEQQ
jgi:phosphoribosylanthranilate isomerase